MNSCSIAPGVSIVTPSFNCAGFIERTIESVRQQDYLDIEHIVVDGGSTDGTVDILKRYDHLHWISEPDEGQSDALNKGFHMALGEIIGWLNADDTYNPGAVSEAVAYLQAHPSVAMVYSHCSIIDEHDHIIRVLQAPAYDLGRELIDHCLPQPTVFMRRDVLASVGYLDDSLHYVMDWDLFLRMGLLYRLDSVDAVWANFRECPGTKTTSQPERFWDEAIVVFDKFFALPGIPDSVRQYQDQAYARVYWRRGIYYHALGGENRVTALASCIQALGQYPLVDKDWQFVAAAIVDTTLKYVHVRDWVEHVNHLWQIPTITDRHRRVLIRRTLAHLYAAVGLMGEEIKVIGLPRIESAFPWLFAAVRHDPAWLRNRGVVSGLARAFFQLDHNPRKAGKL